MNYYLIVSIFLTALACGCSGHRDARLTHVADIVSDSPAEALACLDSIRYGSLSDADRHFHDFLLIKARDKAYVEHESDSLILDVVAYYEGSALYPEALYYAGRVYSDLGDYPSALDYFQKSFDAISGKTADLKGRVLSQTARLLNRLRLYDRAIPCLQEVLALDSMRRDTFSLAYDNELLGTVYIRKRDFQRAEESFIKASRWARHLTSKDEANMRMHLAITKLHQGNVDSAVILIRDIRDKVRPLQRNEAMICASDIYLAAGIPDSAYFYADRLVHSPDGNNRKNGYRNLFKPELFGMIPADSIPVFIRDYYYTLENYYNDHDAQRVMMQDAFFDYRLHQRDREKAEERYRHILYVTVALVLVVLVAAVIILYLRYRRKALLLRLYNAIHELETLRRFMSSDAATSGEAVAMAYGSGSELEILRTRLLEQISLLDGQNEGKPLVDAVILNSDVMRTITRYLDEKKTIPDGSSLWSEIERTVMSASPRFREHLQLLAGRKLKEQDYHVALLIRCGVTPSQMTVLLGRTKGTISYRRRHLCELVMGDSSDSPSIDSIIRCI